MSNKSKDRKASKGKKMSDVRSTDAVAIVCSDIHLNHRPPIARSTEPDWYKAMQRPFIQIQQLMDKHSVNTLLVAGDIFDHWKQPPELINFAIELFRHFPEVIAIPGQHDMPHHHYQDMKRSAYWTLVEAGVIKTLDQNSIDLNSKISVYGFPWEREIVPPDDTDEGHVNIALIHAFAWQKESEAYPGVSKKKHLNRWMKKLQGYQLACFGDNHKGFYYFAEEYGDPWVINCGTLLKRKISEVDYMPHVGIVSVHGTVMPSFLDTSKDKFIDVDKGLEIAEKAMDMTDFVVELRELADKGLDFVESVKLWIELNGIKGRLKKMILESVDQENQK